MKKKAVVVISILALVLVGYVVFSGYRWLFPNDRVQIVEDDINELELPVADTSIVAQLKKNTLKADTVVLTIAGLYKKYKSLKYEFTYDSGGLIKGVNSGNAPLDILEKETFEREIYLGTCSKNVCAPDKGVKEISVFLVFTDLDGKMSQLTKDFTP